MTEKSTIGLRFSSPRARWLLSVLGVAVVYYAAARLGLLLAFEKTNASPVWPPSGIAFALVLWLGPRVWPGIALGACASNVAVFLANGVADPVSIVAVSAGISAGNTLEAVCGAFLLRRLVGPGSPLDRARDVFRFVAVALVMCLVSSLNGPTIICAARLAPWTRYATMWFTWWVGDVAGVLILTPVLYSWFRRPTGAWPRGRRLETAALFEAVALFVALAAVTQLLFGGWLHSISSLPYLVVPGLLWAAFRFGQRETSTAAMLISAIAIWSTIHYTGPFFNVLPGSSDARLIHTVLSGERLSAAGLEQFETLRNEALLLLQIFVCAMAVTAVTLAAAVSERDRSERELRALNETLEQRIRERTAELARSNAELEQFAYVASHDLQEPLRKIQMFGDSLAEEAREGLGEEGIDSLRRMQNAARRMQALIRDLLAYSRVSSRREPRVEVDLAEIVRGVVSDLEARIQETGGLVKVGELAEVAADPLQMRQLLQNLIGNGLKYHRAGEPPVVEVLGRVLEKGNGNRNANEDEDGGLPPGTPAARVFQLVVSDNGIGLEEKDSERIFAPFVRLHGRDEYEGTGMGLAVCRKIAERHGGTITARGSPGQGSRFIVTLPLGARGEGPRGRTGEADEPQEAARLEEVRS